MRNLAFLARLSALVAPLTLSAGAFAQYQAPGYRPPPPPVAAPASPQVQPDAAAAAAAPPPTGTARPLTPAGRARAHSATAPVPAPPKQTVALCFEPMDLNDRTLISALNSNGLLCPTQQKRGDPTRLRATPAGDLMPEDGPANTWHRFR